MGRNIAWLWHGSFSIAAGVLYFFFVLPRWPELMGDTTHTLGTPLRVACGALIGLAALPVVFTLTRTRNPELGTPQLALSIRVGSIVAHVLASVLIIGTAISEIWLHLDTAGRYLYGVYGAAAAIALLGIFAFYLSFVAEKPAPPPKPIKARKPKKRRGKKGEEAAGEDEATGDTKEDEATGDTEEAEAGEIEEAQKPEQTEEPLVEAAAEDAEREAKPEDTKAPEAAEAPSGGLRNRRPKGKVSHRMRPRRTHSGVAVEESPVNGAGSPPR